jgi:hypothetical protein
MRWHFRGEPSPIEIGRDGRLLLPFAGRAWLDGVGAAPEPQTVFAAFLEVVREDDLLIRAIREDAAATAARRNHPPAEVDGCLYCLGDAVHIVLGVGHDAMGTVQRALMARVPARDLVVNAAVEFAGFADDRARQDRDAVTRRAFLDGQCAIHFRGCALSVGYGDAAAIPAAAAARIQAPPS